MITLKWNFTLWSLNLYFYNQTLQLICVTESDNLSQDPIHYDPHNTPLTRWCVIWNVHKIHYIDWHHSTPHFIWNSGMSRLVKKHSYTPLFCKQKLELSLQCTCSELVWSKLIENHGVVSIKKKNCTHNKNNLVCSSIAYEMCTDTRSLWQVVNESYSLLIQEGSLCLVSIHEHSIPSLSIKATQGALKYWGHIKVMVCSADWMLGTIP